MRSIDSYFPVQSEGPGRSQERRSRSPEREKPVSSTRDRNQTSKSDSKFSGTATQSDVILAIQEPYMQQIVSGQKTYEFRRYCLKKSIQRIWFYRTAPHSSIEYVCEILPAKTRNPGDPALEEDGLGNKEFNTRHKDLEGSDFAYKILSVYQLDTPITLNDLKNSHGLKSAPRGLVYTPRSLLELVEWQNQSKLRCYARSMSHRYQVNQESSLKTSGLSTIRRWNLKSRWQQLVNVATRALDWQFFITRDGYSGVSVIPNWEMWFSISTEVQQRWESLLGFIEEGELKVSYHQFEPTKAQT